MPYALVLGLVGRRCTSCKVVLGGMSTLALSNRYPEAEAAGAEQGQLKAVPCACAGADWREVSTLDLVPGDAPGLLLVVGAGPAARVWARAAASASGPPGSCSPGMEPGRALNGESAEGPPTRTGTEARGPTPQTGVCSIDTSGGRRDAEIPTGSEARHCGERPLRIHVVHVCASAEAAAALLAAEGGAAWKPQAGAVQPCIALDLSGRWAALRDVGFPHILSVSSV